MSLLIDALKKAEKAKQDAANNQTDEAIDFSEAIEAGSDRESLLVDEPPLLQVETLNSSEARLEDGFVNPDNSSKPAKIKDNESGLVLSLEDIAPDPIASNKLELEPLANTADVSDDVVSDALTLSDNQFESEPAELSKSQTEDQSVPVQDSADLLTKTETSDGSPSHARKIPELSLEINQPAETESAYGEPHVESTSAETAVVHAREHTVKVSASLKPYRPGTGRKKFWTTMTITTLVVVVIAGVAYYFMNALDNLSGSNTVVKNAAVLTKEDLQPVTEPDPTSAQVQDDVTRSANGNDAVSANSVDPALQKETTTVKQEITQQENTDQSNIQEKVKNVTEPANESAEPRASKSGVKPDIKAKEKKAVKEKPVTEASVKQQAIPVHVPVEKAPLNIIKKQVVDPVATLLVDAYEAYQKNDFQTALNIYRKVLTQDTGNRNALLGIAIIAHRNQQPEIARQYYKKLLELNPKDSQAVAGLMALQTQASSSQDESRLKLLIDQEPQAAHLHYALGNLYVNQGRWNEAQSAFFNAYHYDSDNPDYAYNLAVSLDQLEQGQAALQYYRLALQLAQGKSVNFSFSEVAQRVQQLSNGATKSQLQISSQVSQQGRGENP